MTVRDEALQAAIESFRRPNEESERAERDRILAEQCNESDEPTEPEDEDDTDSDDDSDDDDELEDAEDASDEDDLPFVNV